MRRVFKFVLPGSLFLCALAAAPAARGQVAHPAPYSTSLPEESYARMGSDDSRLIAATGELTGEVTGVLAAKNAVLVRDDKTGKNYEFFVTGETRLRADKGTQLAALRKLSLSDFRAGQIVRLKFRLADAETVELRLRADKR